jgi:Ca2+/Na+ antiporter
VFSCFLSVYLCYTGIVAFMYFRAKAAAHAADYAALPTTDDVNTDGVRLQSPINRSITESSAVHSAPVAPLSVSPTSLDVDFPSSPTGRCRFFPTLSRSTSDLTRLRRTGKGNNEQSPRSGTESPVQMQNGSKRSSPNGLLNNSNGGASAGDVSSGSGGGGGGGGGGEDGYGDSEQASLLVDDVEAFTAGIDTSGSGSDDPASVGNTTEERPLYAIVLRAFHAVYSPIRHVIRSLLPSLHPQVPHFISGDGGTMSGNRNPVVGSNAHVPLRRAALVLACCILAIGVNAVSIVIFCESVIAHLGFSSTAMGATLVALGAEVSYTTLTSKYTFNRAEN